MYAVLGVRKKKRYVRGLPNRKCLLHAIKMQLNGQFEDCYSKGPKIAFIFPLPTMYTSSQFHPLTLLYEITPEQWVQDGLKAVHLLHQQSLAKTYGQL